MAGFRNYYEEIIECLEGDIDIYDDDFSEALEDLTISSTTSGTVPTFNCNECPKVYKTKGGLTRHIQNKHTHPVDDSLDHIILGNIVSKAVKMLSEDFCLSQERRESFTFVYVDNEMVPLLEEIQVMYSQLVVSNNAEQFFASFFSTCVINAAVYFKDLPARSSTMLATKVGEKIFNYFQKLSKNVDTTHSNPSQITDREMDGLQYLSGYVVKNLLKKTKNSANYSSPESQGVIAILENAIEADDSQQRLIHLQNRGGLTAVTGDCLKIFCRTEERFRVETEVDSLRKIDISKISSDLMADVDIISFFNAVVDNIELIDEIKQNLLHKMLKLYLRVRSSSLAKDITGRKTGELSKKSLRKDLKKSIEEAL